jgi:membrane fusion protein (multidrug efflux system)
LVIALALVLAQSACSDPNSGNKDGARELALEAPLARLRVRIQPIQRARLDNTDRVTGTVRAFRRATVTAETQGRVIARSVESGAVVEEGGALVLLESSRFELEVRRTEAALRAARTVNAHAKREYDRAQQLLAQNAISTQHHDDLRHAVERARDEIALAEVARDSAKRNLEDTRIRAPFAGTVDSLAVDVGDFVAPGTAVATLVDLSRVRIFGGVTAREANHLVVGTQAQVSFSDLGGAVFEATLESVGRVAGRADGTYEIELWMDSAEVPMRDGLVAQIAFPDSTERLSLLSPRAAVLRRGGYPEVFVISQENGAAVARTRRIRTGRSHGQWIEILDGLEEGDQVIWDGHFALEDGSIVVIDGLPEVASAAGTSE